ncbi:hypothetical protein [Tautonia marina]|uniref:hypothetical protein n=1 Tax=Tautonia marina TaxID=2653855 RepID=UPI001260B56C|nr:hypothetical protein [Tautonia marina]
MAEPNHLDQIPDAEWETFRRCCFVPRTFRSYPCLLMIEPMNEDGDRFWAPFRGQPFDPQIFELVEEAWDHEHCDVCNRRIEDGDDYWTNDGPEHVDLCPLCHPRVVQRLES